MPGPRYTDIIHSLSANDPFTGPETLERNQGFPFRARLGANESSFGPSPKALEAMQNAISEVWMYADPESHDLRKAIAKHHAIDIRNVVIGEGIDGLLGYLTRLFVAPGDRVVTSDGAYPTFNFIVSGYGGDIRKVSYNGDHEDPTALIAKAHEVGAKLIYLANPDNPMGSWHSGKTIEGILKDIPEGALLILDEAYIELAPEGTAPKIDIEDPRVVRMRTFSKAYGMAGARVGYTLGARDLIANFNKVRNHFGMCRISQAGALAAFEDQDWLMSIRTNVSQARERIVQIAHENDLKPLPSATNFVTIDCGHDRDFAENVVQNLGERGVFIRMPFVEPQNRCIRVSVGKQESLGALAHELPKALAKART